MDKKTFHKLIKKCRQWGLNDLPQFLQLEFSKWDKVQSWLNHHIRMIREQDITYGELNSIIHNYQREINAQHGKADELNVLADEINDTSLSKLNFSFKPKPSYHSELKGLNSMEQQAFFQRRISEAMAVRELMKSHADVTGFLITQFQINKSYRIVSSATPSAPKEANKITSSNADKLTKAESWMNPLMKDITAFKVPKHEDVLGAFENKYPGFSLEFKINDLKTPKFAKGGKYVKKSIALAVIFIYEKKHPGNKIKDYTAITKRYKDLDW